jgi:hypothetical protein
MRLEKHLRWERVVMEKRKQGTSFYIYGYTLKTKYKNLTISTIIIIIIIITIFSLLTKMIFQKIM